VPKTLKIVLGVVVALVVVVGGLTAFSFLRDSAEDEASRSDVPAAANASGRATPDGQWKAAPGEAVFVGYRVHEKLRGVDKEVTGRTPDVTGTMTIAGSQVTEVELKADLTGLKTDDPLRDGAVKRTGLETNTYPEGSFVLTSPITLPATPKIGEEVSASAKGNFTIHDVTKPVEVPVTARWDGDQIVVKTAGAGVRVQFEDYGFGALNTPFASTDDFGYFEFVLVFVPA
jgi:polyisoprenoid-binding protein YceI